MDTRVQVGCTSKFVLIEGLPFVSKDYDFADAHQVKLKDRRREWIACGIYSRSCNWSASFAGSSNCICMQSISTLQSARMDLHPQQFFISSDDAATRRYRVVRSFSNLFSDTHKVSFFLGNKCWIDFSYWHLTY